MAEALPAGHKTQGYDSADLSAARNQPQSLGNRPATGDPSEQQRQWRSGRRISAGQLSQPAAEGDEAIFAVWPQPAARTFRAASFALMTLAVTRQDPFVVLTMGLL